MTIHRLMLFAGASILTVTAALAGLTVNEWYFGSWDCTLDGRPGKMNWRAKEVQDTVCNGDVCSSSSSLTIEGTFQDNGGPVMPLTRLASNAAMVQMRYADGNLWYLAKQGKRAQGWSTWNGRRFALSCWREGSGTYRSMPKPLPETVKEAPRFPK